MSRILAILSLAASIGIMLGLGQWAASTIGYTIPTTRLVWIGIGLTLLGMVLVSGVNEGDRG